MTFRPEALRGGDGQQGAGGVIDYRLARMGVVSEYRKGRLARHEVCDAHPELRRAAQVRQRADRHGVPDLRGGPHRAGHLRVRAPGSRRPAAASRPRVSWPSWPRAGRSWPPTWSRCAPPARGTTWPRPSSSARGERPAREADREPASVGSPVGWERPATCPLHARASLPPEASARTPSRTSRSQAPAHTRPTTPVPRPKRPRPGSDRSILWRWRRGLFVVGLVFVATTGGVAAVVFNTELPPEESLLQTSFVCAADVTRGLRSGQRHRHLQRRGGPHQRPAR